MRCDLTKFVIFEAKEIFLGYPWGKCTEVNEYRSTSLKDK
jgi:hypothetical protein